MSDILGQYPEHATPLTRSIVLSLTRRSSCRGAEAAAAADHQDA